MRDPNSMGPATQAKHRRRAIVLIGMRGSGKTSVGKVLAAVIGHGVGADLAPFSDTFASGGSWTETLVDVDSMIAEASGLSIAEIFAERGEATFRMLERQAIRRVCGMRPAVISVGGGAILDEQNLAALKRIGVLIWLTAPPEVLWERIREDPQSDANRPSLTEKTGLDEIVTLLNRRTDVYRRAADVEIDTAGQTPEQLAGQILAWYDDSPPPRG